MNVPLWVSDLAAAFWAEARLREAFPRSLRAAILRTSFDLTIEELPDLSVAGVERYLARRGCARTCDEIDRPLRGCLVAQNGTGYIFVDARDDLDERTFSLAHELAHFLRDYWWPRRKAVAALGPEILEVLDDRRPARAEERLHALLRQTPIGCQVHLMRREVGLVAPSVEEAERQADRLALELLAPAAEAYRRLQGAGEERGLILRKEFGLPAAVAREYVEILFPAVAVSPLVARLRKALADSRESAPGERLDEQRS